MRNLAASQFEPAVASRRSQRAPSIKPREVVAWASRTRCRVTVRRLCTARTVASAAMRHFLTFLDFYGDLQRDIQVYSGRTPVGETTRNPARLLRLVTKRRWIWGF